MALWRALAGPPGSARPQPARLVPTALPKRMLIDPEQIPRHTVPVIAARDVTARYRELVVDWGGAPGAASGPVRPYTVPGQYVALAPAGAPPRFFAIASLPTELPRMGFLVARGTPTADALARLAPGDAVTISAVLGEGYRSALMPTGPVVVLTTGSGIASVRPVINALLDRGHSGGIRLFYGEEPPCAFAWPEQLDAWRTAGVEVHAVCSVSPEAGAPCFVQDAWASTARDEEVREGAFVLCGAQAMELAARARLEAVGVQPERVHVNV